MNFCLLLNETYSVFFKHRAFQELFYSFFLAKERISHVQSLMSEAQKHRALFALEKKVRTLMTLHNELFAEQQGRNDLFKTLPPGKIDISSSFIVVSNYEILMAK